MLKKILLATVVVVNVANATEVKESGIVDVSSNTKSSGWYAGVGMGIMNWGGSVDIDDGYTSQTFDIDTEDEPLLLKVGYVTSSENRVELYFKKDFIDVVNGNLQAELYETTTFGVNYQWGISSLSSEKMLPYIRVGLGFGSADMDMATVDLDAVEFDLGVGIHYEVSSNIDLTAGIYRRAIGITSEDSDASVISAVNGIEIGAAYHF